MKTKDRYRNAWLFLALLVALCALSGCDVPPAPAPTATARPALPTATVKPHSTPEPTPTALDEPPRATAEQVQQWLDAGEPLFVIDSRSEQAYGASTLKVPGALRLPPHDDIEPYLKEIPHDRRIVIFCT